MKALKNNAGIITITLIILALFFVYRIFSTSKDTEDLVLNPLSQNVGQEVVVLYGSLRIVTLNQSLFSSPAFKSLIDFSTVLEPQPIGRKNPFDLIGAQ